MHININDCKAGPASKKNQEDNVLYMAKFVLGFFLSYSRLSRC